jgi:hypothetical protein
LAEQLTGAEATVFPASVRACAVVWYLRAPRAGPTSRVARLLADAGDAGAQVRSGETAPLAGRS